MPYVFSVIVSLGTFLSPPTPDRDHPTEAATSSRPEDTSTQALMSQNQTRFCLPMCSKANLLIPVTVQESAEFLVRCQMRNPGQLKKPKLPSRFWGSI